MVSARHGIGAGILIIAAVVIGCAAKTPRQQVHAPATEVARAGKASQPDRSGGDAFGEGSASETGAERTEVAPRSVAQHTEAYARNLESMLSKRGAAPDGTDDTVSTIPPVGSYAEGGDATDVSTLANTGMQIEPRADGTAQDAGAAHRNAVADARGAGTGQAPEGNVRSDAAQPSPSWETVTGNGSSRGANGPTTRPAAEAQAAGARSFATPQAAGGGVTDELVRKLTARIKDDPRDAAGHLDYQLLQFLLDEPVPQLSTISTLPAEDRELLTTLLDGLSNFRNGLRAEANMLQSKKVAPLLELADRLRGQADLTLPASLLCKSVKRFGVYEPMDPPRFIAGKKDNEAIIYCEVANFASQMTPDKKWETKLKQEAVLYSETGLAVWSDKSDTVTDLSRNRLHDFFIADKVHIPGNLPVGRYLLKMTVTDLHANRVAEATVPVQFVAQ
jgi:hypothetical protein